MSNYQIHFVGKDDLLNIEGDTVYLASNNLCFEIIKENTIVAIVPIANVLGIFLLDETKE